METQFLSPEISQLRFPDVWLEDGTGNATNSLAFSLKTMSLVMVLNDLMTFLSRRQEGDFFEFYVKSSSFSLQGSGRTAVLVFSDAKSGGWEKNWKPWFGDL